VNPGKEINCHYVQHKGYGREGRNPHKLQGTPTPDALSLLWYENSLSLKNRVDDPTPDPDQNDGSEQEV